MLIEFRAPLGVGPLRVANLMREVLGKSVRVFVDEPYRSEDMGHYLEWCIQSGAIEATFDPFNPPGQMNCGTARL